MIVEDISLATTISSTPASLRGWAFSWWRSSTQVKISGLSFSMERAARTVRASRSWSERLPSLSASRIARLAWRMRASSMTWIRV
jgi:hypothetical protein